MKRPTDERIEQTQRQVTTQAFWLVWLGLLVIMMYRLWVLRRPGTEMTDVFVLWLAATLYVRVRSALSGVPAKLPPGRYWAVPFVIGAVIAGVQLAQHQIGSVVEAALVFCLSYGSALLVLIAPHWLYQRWEKRNLEG